MKISFLKSGNNGSSFYRITQIKDYLLNNNLIKCYDTKNYYSPLSDIVIWQRYDDLEILSLMDKSQINLYEIDDDHWHLPEYLDTAKEYYKNKLKALELFMKSCDGVITTTETLKKAIHTNTQYPLDKIFVIPNYIDFDKLHFANKGGNTINIVWTLATQRADEDIKPVEKPLMNILQKYENVRLYFLGGCPTSFKNISNVIHVPFSDQETYYQNLMRLRFDIGIAPAQNTLFNNCKSNLKVLEYGAIGIPVVASNIDPYRDFFYALKADTEEDWEQHLTDLIENYEIRNQLGIELHNYVKEYFSLEKGINSYLNLFQSLKKEEFDSFYSFENRDKRFKYAVCSRYKEKLEPIKDMINVNRGYYPIDITFMNNVGDIGLDEFYNMVFEKDKNSDYFVFAHDDVYLKDPNWLNKLVKGFEKYDVIGIAGSTYYDPMIGSWSPYNLSTMCSGSCFHKEGSEYVPYNFGPCREVVVTDGMFLAVKREVLEQVKFKAYGKFHFYDISFCLECNKKGFKIGTLPIEIYHDSKGNYNQDWVKALKPFREDYGLHPYKLVEKEFPIEVVIDHDLQFEQGFYELINSLEKQSVNVNYRLGDGGKFFIDDIVMFFPDSFEKFMSVMDLNEFDKIKFYMGSEEFFINISEGDSEYVFNTYVGKRYCEDAIVSYS